MEIDWQSVYILLTITSVFIGGVVGYLSWRHHNEGVAYYFTAFTLSAMLWSLWYAGNLASNTLAYKITFIKLAYLNINSLPVFWLLFSTQYTGHPHWITNKRVALLSIVPVISLLFVWSNEWHQLFWSNQTLVEQHNMLIVESSFGPVYWLTLMYNYLLLFSGMGLMLRAISRSTRLQRQQLILLTISTLIPFLGSITYIFKLGPLPNLNLAPASFSLSGLILYWIITRHHILSMPALSLAFVIAKLRDSVMVVDRTGRIVDVNPSLAELMSMPITDMLGKTPEEVFAAYPDLLETYIDTRTTETTERRVTNTSIIKGDTALFVELDFITLQTDEGVLSGELIVLHDVTESRQAQIAASRRFIELRSLRNINTVISSTLDLDQVLEVALESVARYSKADAGFIGLVEGSTIQIVQVFGSYEDKNLLEEVFPITFGITGRAIRKRRSEFIHHVHQDPDYNEDVPETESLICVPLISHDTIIGTLTIETANQANFTNEVFEFVKMLATNVAIALENAQLYRISRDQILELRNLYEQVKTLEQLKTDMIRIASHDLKSPSATIRGYLNLFELDQDKLSEEHFEWVKEMIYQTERTQNIIDDILSLERMEAETVYNPIDLNELILHVVKIHEQLIKSKSQNLVINMDENKLIVSGDIAQLREAMINIVNNAIKYTPEKGDIQINLENQAGKVIFTVVDTGYGIPKDLQSKLFEPFYRAVHYEVRQIEGTGLGLHLVKNVIQRHGDNIRFHSEHKKGSTFGFELPLIKD